MGSPFWAIVFLAIALALLFAEVFIPSGGMILAAAVLCVILSLWSANAAWWDSNQTLFWGFVATAVILIPISLSSAIALWPRTALGRKSEPPTLEEVTPYLEEQRRLEQLIGQTGEADTPLNPGGLIRIQGKRLHCRSEGMIVAKGTPVVVLAVSGNSLLVREAPAQPKTALDSDLTAQTPPPARTDGTLDFDVPTT